MASDVEEIDICDEDSDVIDSDLETELYSLVHHETNLSTSNHCSSVNSFNNKLEIIKNSHALTREEEIKILINGQNIDEDSTTKILHNSQTKKTDQLLNKSQENVFRCTPNSIPSTMCKSTNIANLKDFLSLMETSSDSSSQELHSKSQTLSSSYSGSKSEKRKSYKKAIVKKPAVESDSDSVINLSDDDTRTKSDLIMNFSSRVNVDIFDLDSSSNDSLSSKLINPSNHDSARGGISDPWHFSSQDKDLQSKAKARKYINKYYCNKCKRLGHPKQFCSLNSGLKCSICAGDHSFNRCRNQICGKCYQLGHFSKQCCFELCLKCNRCGMKGHELKDCPDLWRRFHLTTNSTQLEETQKLLHCRPIYCFNCGEKGHFGPTCTNPRSSTLPYPTWPAVISYEDSIAKMKQKTKRRKKQLEDCSKPCTNPQPTNRPFQTFSFKNYKNPIAERTPELTKAQKRKKQLENCQSVQGNILKKLKLSIMGPSRNKTRKEYMLNNVQKNCTFKSSNNNFPRTPKAMSNYYEERWTGMGIKGRAKSHQFLYK